MSKRSRDGSEGPEAPQKRQRSTSIDRLSQLSDELLLRILAYVSVSNLIRCQRVSRKFHSIAGDSQLWRPAYYERFVRPRASRLPRIKGSSLAPEDIVLPSRLSKWLDEGNLIQRGHETNWKRQYKLRDNWSRGNCGVSEIDVAKPPAVPPLLVRLHDGIVFTADPVSGLRAWLAKKDRKLMARVMLKEQTSKSSPKPTCMAVDATCHGEDIIRVLLGLDNGQFSLYALQKSSAEFRHLYTHTASSNGKLSAVAYSSPYLVTITASQLLSVYRIQGKAGKEQGMLSLEPPRLLQSLKSHTMWQPLSLSIRSSSNGLIASVAFTLPTLLSGWTIGLQELRMSLDDAHIESRLASAGDDAYRSLLGGLPASSSSTGSASSLLSGWVGSYTTKFQECSKPTSISYSHPYLLVSHPDNTLTLYLVTSTADRLCISPGSRLWGHTSSVSGAQIGDKGKAVSVSSRGEELRVWELEGGLLASANRKRPSNEKFSVRIRPTVKPSGGAGLPVGKKLDTRNISRGWVGFDEENVIVLRENIEGAQALVIYDFT